MKYFVGAVWNVYDCLSFIKISFLFLENGVWVRRNCFIKMNGVYPHYLHTKTQRISRYQL